MIRIIRIVLAWPFALLSDFFRLLGAYEICGFFADLAVAIGPKSVPEDE